MVDFPVNLRIDPGNADREISQVRAQLRQVEQSASVARERLNQTNRVRFDRAEQQIRGLRDELRRVQQESTRTSNALSGIGRALGAVGVGFSAAVAIREYAQLSDAVTNVSNRLRLVTDDTRELASVQQELFDISNRSRVAFESTAQIFGRLAVSASELGVSNQQLLQFTESLNQAVVLSGASAQEANAGLIQLSQGLASGALRGDELRSVLEQLPAVADVIAQGLGVTRGELRKLGEQGLITATNVLDAFKEARTELNERFATTTSTIGQAITRLNNSLTEYVGRVNSSTSASAGLAASINFLADNISTVAGGVSILVGGGAAGFGLAGLVTLLKSANTAKLSLIASTARYAAGLGVLTTAVLAANRALEFQAQLLEDIEEANNAATETAGAGLTFEAKELARVTRERNRLLRQFQEVQRQGGVISESQRERLALLNREIERLRDSLGGAIERQKEAITAQKNAEKASKDDAAAKRRQEALLKKIRQPLEDYKNLVSDLSALLQKGAIDQRTFNAAVAEFKPKRVDTFGGESDAFDPATAPIREEIEDLRLRRDFEGQALEFEQARLELKREGIALDDQQLARLRQLIEERAELRGEEEAREESRRQAQEDAARRQQILNNTLQETGAALANNLTRAWEEYRQSGEFNSRQLTSAILDDLQRVLLKLLLIKAVEAAGGTGFASTATGSALVNFGTAVGTSNQRTNAELRGTERVRQPFAGDPVGGGRTVAGAQAGGGAAPAVTIVNVDSEERALAALRSPEGGEIVLNQLAQRRQRARRAIQA